MTKTNACKGAGEEGSLGITFHAPENVGECEGMNPPHSQVSSKLKSRKTPKFSKGDYKGQNQLD
jgi:hypothetical protein